MRKLLKSSAGFTLIAAMVMVVIMGIMLGAASQSWRTIMQREREEELLFRGRQIRDAIAKWHTPRPMPGQPQPPPRPLGELKYLLEDPNSTEKVRYLRRIYPDPITGEDFELITDPVRGIVGVKSASTDQPLKKGNFPDDLKNFADRNSYSEWEFDYRTMVAAAPAGGAPGGAASE